MTASALRGCRCASPRGEAGGGLAALGFKDGGRGVRRRQRNGTWHRILTQLQSLADAYPRAPHRAGSAACPSPSAPR
ncbi:hypothetical protein SGPA1_41231 [Streptomyces misionensis JCM 4497]